MSLQCHYDNVDKEHENVQASLLDDGSNIMNSGGIFAIRD